MDTEAQDFASGAGVPVAPGVAGVLALPVALLFEEAGPAAFDSL